MGGSRTPERPKEESRKKASKDLPTGRKDGFAPTRGTERTLTESLRNPDQKRQDRKEERSRILAAVMV